MSYFQSLFVLLTCSPFFLVSQTKFSLTFFFHLFFVFVSLSSVYLRERKTGRGAASNSLSLPLPNSFSPFRLRDVFKFWEREEFCFYESGFLGFCFDTHDP